ncbi:MAG: hypothetical protein GXO32_06420 [Crenarchaeota archaeon]|nr:hypothetical protein [Thermoproteota archaeon]
MANTSAVRHVSVCSELRRLRSDRELLDSVAELIYGEFLREERGFAVVDRLATGVSTPVVKFALYELLRAAEARGDSRIEEVVSKILAGLDSEECLELALELSRSIAVLALAKRFRG